ncbi:alpha/beta fold hydrolase [Pseudomonas fluorescens]|uniref:Alpha/beta fold hydrolase n=1 Tax=Pseudomonas fluorescens TaxID=294 RepID=A0A7M2J131_PSEFL|nr:alpha/beta fold hydrolase [Pseudomonas fluorescens]
MSPLQSTGQLCSCKRGGQALQRFHGSWADGSSWSEVITRLQAAPTVLVGHSYAGSVVSDSGVNPKVSALVYVAARAQRSGRARRLPHPEPGRLPQVLRRRRATCQGPGALRRATTDRQDAVQWPNRECRLAHQTILVRRIYPRPDHQPGPRTLPRQAHERQHDRAAVEPLVAGIPRQGNHRSDPRSVRPPALSLLLRTCHDPVGWLFVSPGYCELTANDRATRP